MSDPEDNNIPPVFCAEEFRRVCDIIWDATRFKKQFDGVRGALDDETGLVAAIEPSTPVDSKAYYKLGQRQDNGTVKWFLKGEVITRKELGSASTHVFESKLVNKEVYSVFEAAAPKMQTILARRPL